MKLLYTCARCAADIEVSGPEHQLRDLLKEKCLCPTCRQPMLEHATRDKHNELYELSVGEFFQAVNGFGFPEEISAASTEAIIGMLMTSPIERVVADTTRTGRCTLLEIGLSNGVTLHLTASGEGAVVYKVTRKKETEDGQSSGRGHEVRGGCPEDAARCDEGGDTPHPVRGPLGEESGRDRCEGGGDPLRVPGDDLGQHGDPAGVAGGAGEGRPRDGDGDRGERASDDGQEVGHEAGHEA